MTTKFLVRFVSLLVLAMVIVACSPPKSLGEVQCPQKPGWICRKDETKVLNNIKAVVDSHEVAIGDGQAIQAFGSSFIGATLSNAYDYGSGMYVGGSGGGTVTYKLAPDNPCYSECKVYTWTPIREIVYATLTPTTAPANPTAQPTQAPAQPANTSGNTHVVNWQPSGNCHIDLAKWGQDSNLVMLPYGTQVKKLAETTVTSWTDSRDGETSNVAYQVDNPIGQDCWIRIQLLDPLP